MLLIGAKPVPLARKMIGFELSSRRKKRAERSLEAQDLPLLHLVEHVRGEGSARVVPQMQLQMLVVVGSVRHREGAPLAVLQQDLDVLTGKKLQALIRRQPQVHGDDVGCEPFQLLHPAGQHLDRNVTDRADFARFDHEIRQRLGLAEKCEACLTVGIAQRRRLVAAEVDFSLEHAVPCMFRMRRRGIRTATENSGATPQRARFRRVPRRTRGHWV